MSRFNDTSFETTVAAHHVPFVCFVDFALDSGHIRLCSWDRNYTFNGFTWYGDGKWLTCSAVNESSSMSSDNLSFEIAGTHTAMLNAVLAENYSGRSVTLYIATAYADSYELTGTPKILWEGFIDTGLVRCQANSKTILLSCEDRFILWNRNVGLIYSHEHQTQRVDATDLIFNMTATSVDKVVTWGGTKVGVAESMAYASNSITASVIKKMGFGLV